VNNTSLVIQRLKKLLWGWIMMFNAAYKTIFTGTMAVSFIGLMKPEYGDGIQMHSMVNRI
jgi:hypothetical protein